MAVLSNGGEWLSVSGDFNNQIGKEAIS